MTNKENKDKSRGVRSSVYFRQETLDKLEELDNGHNSNRSKLIRKAVDNYYIEKKG